MYIPHICASSLLSPQSLTALQVLSRETHLPFEHENMSGSHGSEREFSQFGVWFLKYSCLFVSHQRILTYKHNLRHPQLAKVQ